MALCDLLTSGISKSCDNNTAGVSKIYISDFERITGTTETAGELTAITLSGGTGSFYEFEFNRNTSSYSEDLTIDLANGSSFYAQTVNLVLSRREKTKREAISQLTAGQKELFVIVLDSNGLYWAFGVGEGCIVTGIAGGSGVNKGDANNYQITMTAEEANSALEVDSTIVAALLA